MVASFIITVSMFCFVFIVDIGLLRAKGNLKKERINEVVKVRANCRQGTRAVLCQHRQVRRTRVKMLENFVHWFGYIGAYTHVCICGHLGVD